MNALDPLNLYSVPKRKREHLEPPAFLCSKIVLDLDNMVIVYVFHLPKRVESIFPFKKKKSKKKIQKKKKLKKLSQ